MNLAIHKNKEFTGVHPQKFALWCAFASIFMMFAAMTSAYIVRKSAGNWLEFNLPSVFYVSTVVIILSSVTLHLSYRSYLTNKPTLYRGLLGATFILGLAFLALQYEGWMTLIGEGIFLGTNPSSSFMYIITGLHAAHILGGLGGLTVAFVHAVKLQYKLTEKRKNRFELVVSYWHFVDALWIYLLIFLIVQ